MEGGSYKILDIFGGIYMEPPLSIILLTVVVDDDNDDGDGNNKNNINSQRALILCQTQW